MKTLVLAALMVVAGCSGQDIGPVEPAQLAASWRTAPIGGCSTALKITPETFELDTSCDTADGPQLQGVAGVYSVDGDVLTMTADRATCGNAPRVYVDTVALEPDALLLTNVGGTQTFQRADAPAGAYGCFINGTFTPSPLAPL